MSENVTFEYIVDEAEEILDEADDYSEHDAYRNIKVKFEKCYFPFLIVIGVPCNILAFVILIRRRLWLHHEAYIYLATILILNAATLVVLYGDLCLRLFNDQLARLSLSTDIFCKLWNWADYVISCMNWLHVLMLLNVYLRQQPMTSSYRRGCFMNLASKYCTLFGTKVVITSFFIFSALANFSSFSLSILRHTIGDWYCSPFMFYSRQFKLLSHVSWWLRGCISLLLVIPLLLLVVWKIKRRSGFTFSHTTGVSQDDGDVEVMVRIALLCAGVSFVLNAPLVIVYALHIIKPNYHETFQIAFEAVRLISFASTLSTPIVCFAVKSRFRDELGTIVEGCRCLGTRCHRILPQEADSDGAAVLQMDHIEEDSSITGN